MQNQEYSFKRNLIFMGYAFSKAKKLIYEFIKESSPLYGLVPLIILSIVFSFENWLGYLFQWSIVNPFPKILPIHDDQYRLYEIFFSPPINFISFLIFAGILHLFSKLMKSTNISVKKVTFFSCLYGILLFI